MNQARKTQNALEGFLILLMVLPMIYLLMVYGNLPAEVPTHFKADGTPDDWSAKWSLWVILPALQFFIFLLLKYAPTIDPKRNLVSGVFFMSHSMLA